MNEPSAALCNTVTIIALSIAFALLYRILQ